MALHGIFDTIAVRVQNGFRRVHQGAVYVGFYTSQQILDTKGVEVRQTLLAITPFDAILDRALRNDRWKSTDGEELISKQQSIRHRNGHYIVSQEPVKDKPPSAVAV